MVPWGHQATSGDILDGSDWVVCAHVCVHVCISAYTTPSDV